MKKFSHIDTWVFDLDNTLYNADTYIFKEMGKRMTHFVADTLDVDHDTAEHMRNHYYTTYGTTLRGLMTEHDIAPEVFLEHIHALDVTQVPPCRLTQKSLTQLPGRKVVYTNASKKFAEDMLSHLGIADQFDGLFAIEDADYNPKPDMQSYHSFMEKHNVDPKSACMFEDTAKNLRPAHALGMTTVLILGAQQKPDDADDYVHHISDRLPDWFTATLGATV